MRRLEEASDSKLFVVNSGTHNHGIIEPQLSLAAWRAATILNSVSDEVIYNNTSSSNIMDWDLQSHSSPKIVPKNNPLDIAS